MRRHALTITCAALCTLVVVPIAAEEVVRYESRPGQPVFPVRIDVWTRVCPAGGSATVAVDTVALASGAASPIDPVFEVYSPTGGFVGFGDDETACTAATTCAFDCPAMTMDCTEGGEQTLLVLTGTSLGCGEEEGPYELSVQVFDGLGGSGTPQTADVVRLGGEPMIPVMGWGSYPAGPALDDQPHGFFPPLGGVDGAERLLRLSRKVRQDR